MRGYDEWDLTDVLENLAMALSLPGKSSFFACCFDVSEATRVARLLQSLMEGLWKVTTLEQFHHAFNLKMENDGRFRENVRYIVWKSFHKYNSKRDLVTRELKKKAKKENKKKRKAKEAEREEMEREFFMVKIDGTKTVSSREFDDEDVDADIKRHMKSIPTPSSSTLSPPSVIAKGEFPIKKGETMIWDVPRGAVWPTHYDGGSASPVFTGTEHEKTVMLERMYSILSEYEKRLNREKSSVPEVLGNELPSRYLGMNPGFLNPPKTPASSPLPPLTAHAWDSPPLEDFKLDLEKLGVGMDWPTTVLHVHTDSSGVMHMDVEQRKKREIDKALTPSYGTGLGKKEEEEDADKTTDTGTCISEGVNQDVIDKLIAATPSSSLILPLD